jgi:hypothetical protein
VLTIFLAGQSGDDSEPWFYEGTTAELFRTVRVVGSQIVFIEVSPGHLINVAHIERIAEDVACTCEQPDELTAPPGYATVAPGTATPNAEWVGGAEPATCSGCGSKHVGACGLVASQFIKPCTHGNTTGACMDCLGEVL